MDGNSKPSLMNTYITMTTTLLPSQQDQEIRPPKVTAPQWALVLGVLFLAGLSYAFSSYEELSVLLGFIMVVNMVLLGSILKEMFSERAAGKFLLVISLLGFFWLEAWSMSVQSVPFSDSQTPLMLTDRFGIGIIQQAMLYIAVFQTMLFAGYSIRLPLRRSVAWLRHRIDNRSRTSELIRYGLAACALVPFFISYQMDVTSILLGLIAAQTTDVTFQDNFIDRIFYFGMYASSLLLAESVLFQDSKRYRKLIVGGFAAIPTVLIGARHILLYVVLPIFLLAFIKIRGHVPVSRMIRWGLVGVCFLIIFQFQILTRFIGWDAIEEITWMQLLPANVTHQFTALMFALYLVPHAHAYFMEPTTPFFLTHWAPRFLWAGKPEMQAWRYYDDTYTNLISGYNVTPSVIGQFHLNWGPPGVLLIGLWLGFLTYAADRLLLSINPERQRTVVIALGMFYAFILSSFRFYAPYYFAYFVFGVVAMLMLSRHQHPSTN